LNLLGFWILSILKHQKATVKVNGMTFYDIAATEDLGCKENTIYKQLKQFVASGYVALGVKDGRANTYYITKSGLEYLRKESEES
jgi:DNA-binding PadR family transcriptional regulator